MIEPLNSRDVPVVLPANLHTGDGDLHEVGADIVLQVDVPRAHHGRIVVAFLTTPCHGSPVQIAEYLACTNRAPASSTIIFIPALESAITAIGCGCEYVPSRRPIRLTARAYRNLPAPCIPFLADHSPWHPNTLTVTRYTPMNVAVDRILHGLDFQVSESRTARALPVFASQQSPPPVLAP